MSLKSLSAFALVGLISTGVAATVIAQESEYVVPGTVEEIVEARQAMMRENGGILRSAGGLSGQEAVAAMQTLAENFSHISPLFPEGSLAGDTKALPVIWESWDEFVAISDAGQAAAEEAITLAEAGDMTGYAAAVKTIGGTCGQCHQQFRTE